MYYNGYIRLYTVTVATLFLLSPLLALPYILLGIYRQERSAYFFFALFLGFLAWLQVPLSDLFRHSLNIYHYLDKPFSYAYVNKQSADYFILDIGKRQHSISISPVVFSNREFLLADSHIQLYD